MSFELDCLPCRSYENLRRFLDYQAEYWQERPIINQKSGDSLLLAFIYIPVILSFSITFHLAIFCSIDSLRLLGFHKGLNQ